MGKPKPLDERIARIKERQDKLAAQGKQLAAKDRAQKRKEDTRRKIVVGAAILTLVEKDPMIARMLARHFDKAVTRPQDRELIAHLFSPPPLTATPGGGFAAPAMVRAASEIARPVNDADQPSETAQAG